MLRARVVRTFRSIDPDVQIRASVDPASTNHDVVVEEHDGLPGGHRYLRLRKHHFRSIAAERTDERRRRPMPMTDLRRHRSTVRGRIEYPVHTRRGQRRLLQRPLRTHHHLVIGGLERDDVERRRGGACRCGNPQPAPLAHREPMDAVMMADNASIEIDDRTARNGLGISFGDERSIVVIGNEANLLAIGLFGNRQTALTRVLAHGLFRTIADR